MQYPIIDLITSAYINNGWTGLDIPETITYEPIQIGSGEPSPTNVRPILPSTILNIGGNDVPVYGGSLDVTTGLLTVDMASVDLGTLTWTRIDTQSPHWRFWAYLDTLKQDGELVSSQYKTIGASEQWAGAQGIATQLISNISAVMVSDEQYNDETTFKNAMDGVQLVYELKTPITYQLTQTELENAIGIKDDIAHRLKLPLPHYFPHPVIDALQRAAASTQTTDDTEILRHYLTPLGIGGI